jgi:hypothetical protein
MAQSMDGAANAPFFGLDVGDWSGLLSGFALAWLVLFWISRLLADERPGLHRGEPKGGQW